MFKPARIGLIGPLPAHGPISVCPCCAARSLLWTRSTPYRAVWADRWSCGQGRHRQARCGLKRCKEPMVKSVATTIGFCNTSVKLKSMEVFQEATSSLVVPSATGRPGAAKSQPPERDIFCTCARDAIQAPARRHLWRQVQAAAESKPSSASLGPARDELRMPQAAGRRPQHANTPFCRRRNSHAMRECLLARPNQSTRSATAWAITCQAAPSACVTTPCAKHAQFHRSRPGGSGLARPGLARWPDALVWSVCRLTRTRRAATQRVCVQLAHLVVHHF